MTKQKTLEQPKARKIGMVGAAVFAVAMPLLGYGCAHAPKQATATAVMKMESKAISSSTVQEINKMAGRLNASGKATAKAVMKMESKAISSSTIQEINRMAGKITETEDCSPGSKCNPVKVKATYQPAATQSE